MIDLVTGASGFLGGRLVQVLAGLGGRVRILDRKGELSARHAGLRIEVIQGDLSDTASLKTAVKGVTRIFNCAGCSTDWAPWKAYYEANVAGVGNLLAAAASEPTLQRFLHVSTTDVYGYPEMACDEAGPLQDTGLPYNRSKVMGERLVWEAGGNGLPITIIRPSSIYGPHSKDFVTEMAKLLRGRVMMYVEGGKSMGGFVHVDDVVEAMIAASSATVAKNQAYNITPESDASWKAYSEALADALGVKRPWLNLPFGVSMALGGVCEGIHRLLRITARPVLTRHAVLLFKRNQNYPNGKAARDFGYRPRIDLATGISQSAKWLLDL